MGGDGANQPECPRHKLGRGSSTRGTTTLRKPSSRPLSVPALRASTYGRTNRTGDISILAGWYQRKGTSAPAREANVRS